MAIDSQVEEKLNRVEEVIEHLDVEKTDLDDGEELYEEGSRLLEEVREGLAGEPGTVTEIE